ncbi:MAG TPA: phosphoribosyltransferase family protein [Candidatus Saccharimonadales bacterium]|nr:phosphoribosyltransferase family protein [Candidatus Saccharimonadales bacterium]
MSQAEFAPTPIAEVPQLVETWKSVYLKSLQLSQQIRDHCAETDERFDAMVVVPRGSYYPANILSRELGFGAVDLLHACIHSYATGASERREHFEVGQMPPPEMIRDKNLLVVEEVCDTGQSLHFLFDYLQTAGAGLVRTGVLHYKPERSETDFVPDWYVTQTNDWIVYPWEVHEINGESAGVKRELTAE